MRTTLLAAGALVGLLGWQLQGTLTSTLDRALRTASEATGVDTSYRAASEQNGGGTTYRIASEQTGADNGRV